MDKPHRSSVAPVDAEDRDIARWVRMQRQRAGQTQASLAAALGVKQPTIARYERGARRIPFPILQRIADTLRSQLDRRFTAKGLDISDVRGQLATVHASLHRAVHALEALQERLDAPGGEGSSEQMASTVTARDREHLGRWLVEVSMPSSEREKAPVETTPDPPYRLVLWPKALPFHPRRRPDPQALNEFLAETQLSRKLRLLFVTQENDDARAAGILAGDIVCFDPALTPQPREWVVVRTSDVYTIRRYAVTMRRSPIPQTSPGDTPEEDHQYWAAWAAQPLYVGTVVAVCRSKPPDGDQG